jgi:hypothetical protein
MFLAAHPTLGSLDSVLAAVAMRPHRASFVSAERVLAGLPGLRHVDPADPSAVGALLSEDGNLTASGAHPQ